jgi:hypothetical protein
MPPHYQTWGAVLDSSKTCPFYQVMVSHFDDDARSFNRSSEFSESGSTNEYAFLIKIRESRTMPSGVAWALIGAYFTNLDNIFYYHPGFTLLTCRAEGKTAYHGLEYGVAERIYA